MIRIVGVQRHENVSEEFVLLQNQGSMKVNLKGHVVAAQCALDGDGGKDSIHIFCEEIDVLPGMYVLLRTCPGVGHWNHSHDRFSTYYSYMQNQVCVWMRHPGTVHVMAPQHSWVERRPEAMLS